MNKPKNPPAFPSDQTYEYNGETYGERHEGMTLLDYFAGKALTGLAVSDLPAEVIELRVRNAFHIADLALLEREKHL